MLVIGNRPLSDTIAVEQHAGDAGVFACKHIGGGQRLQRTDGDVAEIADRRRDEIKRRLQRPRDDHSLADHEAARWRPPRLSGINLVHGLLLTCRRAGCKIATVWGRRSEQGRMGFGLSMRRLCAVALLAALSACETVPFGIPGLEPSEPGPATPPVAALPPARGEVIGTGPVRVALLLPLTAPGNGAKAGIEFRNAAQLAAEDFGLQTLQVVIKDTAGKPELALAMANEANMEGASAVLGPLFAAEVSQAATVLRPSGKVQIAFSSDRSVAGGGTYLNSFQPEGVVERGVTFAISKGYRSFVALVPNGRAGDIAQEQLRRTLAANGGSLVQIARYDYDNSSLQVAASSIVQATSQAQAVFIPDGGNSPNAIVAALKSNGVDLTSKKLIGTGQWTTSNLTDPALAGAWFADADQAKLATYKGRYRQKFGADPSANSALAYDTVALAAGTVKQRGAAGFTRQVIEAPSGFSGYTGIFRFLADGTSQRGYAVYEVGAGGVTTVASPAPTSF